MFKVEWVKEENTALAMIIRAESKPGQTTFLTPESYLQQAGFVVYPAGGHIPAHDHKPLERHIVGTSECLLVWEGSVIAHLYGLKREKVAEIRLDKGDVILLVNGGHAFTMLEDTIFLEIKQGPYTGLVEKERFE